MFKVGIFFLKTSRDYVANVSHFGTRVNNTPTPLTLNNVANSPKKSTKYNYEKKKKKSKLKLIPRVVTQTHCDSSSSSELEVNLSGQCRTALAARMKQEDAPINLFSAAQVNYCF